jgi:hypothetical protein
MFYHYYENIKQINLNKSCLYEKDDFIILFITKPMSSASQ